MTQLNSNHRFSSVIKHNQSQKNILSNQMQLNIPLPNSRLLSLLRGTQFIRLRPTEYDFQTQRDWFQFSLICSIVFDWLGIWTNKTLLVQLHSINQLKSNYNVAGLCSIELDYRKFDWLQLYAWTVSFCLDEKFKTVPV